MEALMKLCPVKEAAEILGCSTGYVRRLLLDGELEGQKLGERVWAVERASLNRFNRKTKTVGRPRLCESKKSA